MASVLWKREIAIIPMGLLGVLKIMVLVALKTRVVRVTPLILPLVELVVLTELVSDSGGERR